MRYDRSCRPASSRALLVAALAILLAFPLESLAASVWVTSSTEKVLPSASARAASPVDLRAAKNEFEAFQIAVTGDSGAVLDVTAAATPLTGPQTIPPPRLFREELITLAQASSNDGFTGAVPDALVPDVDDVVGEQRSAFPFDVSSGQTRVIWAEVHVPPGAPAGVYQGNVTVSAGGATIATVPVTLTVWDFALPSTSSLKSHFAIYYGDLPAQHGVSGDAFSALRARYAQLGLDHRISMGGVDDGNRDLDHFAQFYGALVDGTAPTQLPGAKLTSVQFMGSRSTASYASWASFFKARGWFDRLFDYTCDEPPATCAWSDIPARNATMKAADPAFRSLVTTTVQQATSNGVLSSIDILTPVVNEMDDKPGTTYSGVQAPKYQSFLAAAPQKELWMYQSCMSHGCGGTSDYFNGWPSYMIDTQSIRSRAMEWLSFAWGVTGELYWETTWAYATGSSDPWRDQWQFSGNGDGNLLYPGTPARIGGTTHIPVASLRLKMIRAGMQDFEYLKLLADAGDALLAKQLATTLFPNAWTTPSISDLLAARDRIAARILELTGKPPASGAVTTVDPGAGSASGGGGAVPGGSAAGDSGDSAGSASSGISAVAGAGPTGSGCSAGSAAEALAGLGLLAALAVRRRRR